MARLFFLVSNKTDLALLLSGNVKTGWEDGKIRSFYPESGKEMYIIHNAHNKVII